MRFLYIPLDYLSTLTKREGWVDFLCPLLIGFGSAFFLYCQSSLSVQYNSISDVQPLLQVLLGFTLAALTLLLSNGKMESATRNYPSNRKVRGRVVSVYRYIVIHFSYLILCESIECLLFYIASIYPLELNWCLCSMINSLAIAFILHIFFVTIRTISNLYLIIIREF